MVCRRKATETNNQPSKLFDYIYNNLANQKEELADSYYSYFKSDIFKSEFGDWVADYNRDLEFKLIDPRKVDDNGEPILNYDKVKGKHYYNTLSNTRVYYPSNRGKLNELYSFEAIREITKTLALKYIEPRINNKTGDVSLDDRSGTLSDFIGKYINYKVNELENSNDFRLQDNAEGLQESLKYKDEWIRHIENFYRELKLVYNEKSDTDEMIENEESTREGQTFGVASFERSSKSNISSNIKLRLSLMKDSFIDKNGELNYNLDNYLNEPKLLSFDDVYSTLQKSLTNQVALEGEDLFDIYTNNIKDLSSKKPYLASLMLQLEQMDFNQKAEFVSAFNLDKNNFIGTTYTSTPIFKDNKIIGYNTSIVVQNLSDVGDKTRQVKELWFHNFNKKFTDNKSLYTPEKIQEFVKLKKMFNRFSEAVKVKMSKNQYDEQSLATPINSLISFYSDLGMTITEDAFNHYLDGGKPLTASFEERRDKLRDLIIATNWFFNNTTFNNISPQNPFETQAEFNEMADAMAFYMPEGSDASIFTVGKSKWIYSYPSYLSTKIKQWKKNRATLLEYYQSKPITESSHYMRYLLGMDVNEDIRDDVSDARMDEYELNIFNSLQEPNDSSNAVDNTTMSLNDAFADNYNKVLMFKTENKDSYISTAAPADKSMQYQFKIPKGMLVNTNIKYDDNGKLKASTEARKILYTYARGEYLRILQTQKEIEEAGDDTSRLITNYHLGNKNGLKFQLFTSLNKDKFDADKRGFELYDTDGKIIEYELADIRDIIDLEDLNPLVYNIEHSLLKLVDEVLNDNILNIKDHLYDIKMIEKNEKGELVNKAFDNEIWESYDNSDITDIKIAGDILINNLIAQVEYSKMFAGDVAYYKNMADYTKRIPATYTDGLQLYITEGNEKFNASIIEGVEIMSPYYEAIEKTIGKDLAKHYRKINSTDAQAWITVNRWEFLMRSLGKWSPSHDIVLDKINGVNKEPFTNEELKLVAQPLKGVYFEINNGVPTYLKYSQAVLLPDLIKNSPGLAKLAQKMEDANIDELITIDGVKVGAIQPVLTHNEDGTIKDDFELTPLELKNSGWKLQQDLPVKTFKPTDLGSQLQKNIYSGLAPHQNEIFEVDGKLMSGSDLITYINTIISDLSDIGLEELHNEFGIDANYNITNKDKLYTSLLNELKSRGAAQNVIDALETGVTLYAIPGYQQKIQNTFASMVLKRIVKIQTNGGAFIQMSNYGFSNDDAVNDGVIYTPWAEKYISEPKFLTDENGDFILSENGKKIVKPGGILISGSFIAKYVPDYKKYRNNPEKLFGTAKNDYRDGMIDSKILKNIIGYRIPNQGLASNDALEIVGILPEAVGDTVVAYTGITTKTGSDFDIDKMYIMMPSFRPQYKAFDKTIKYLRKKYSKDLLEDSIASMQELIDELEDTDFSTDIKKLSMQLMTYSEKMDLEDALLVDLTTAIVNSNSSVAREIKDNVPNIEVVEKLSYIQNNKKEGLQNQLIQAYKSVLTHPDNIKDIMTPIDHPHIKDDIVDLYPKGESNDLDNFNATKDIYTKYEFLLGQAGVGITANQLVDHNRGLLSDLKVPYLNLGYKSSNTLSKLDETFSEELSDADYKYYSKVVEEINKTRKPEDKINIKNLKSIKIADSLSAIMNAFVDIAKDSYITRGNWSTVTSNIGLMLIRAGVHPFKVNAIIGQPIIREYLEFVNKSESKIVNETGNLMDKFIDSKIESELEGFNDVTFNDKTRSFIDIYRAVKYDGSNTVQLARLFGAPLNDALESSILKSLYSILNKYQNIDSSTINEISLKKLRDGITHGNLDFKSQMVIFENFREWNDIAKNALGLNIKASKVDVDAYGKNVSSMIITLNSIHTLMDPAFMFKGFNTKLKYGGKSTFLDSYINNAVFDISKIMASNPHTFLSAHPTIVNTFNFISNGIKGSNLLDSKLGDKIEKAYYTYFMSGFPPLNISSDTKLDLINNLPTRLLEFIENNPNYNNKFIKELVVKVGENGRDFITMSNRQKSPSVQTDLTNAWNDLRMDHPVLANDLIKYSFITSGLQMSMNQFHTYIPYQFFAENGINDYINSVADELSSFNVPVDHIFIENFFRNNVKDDQIVRRVFDSEIDKSYGAINTGFVLKNADRGNLYVKRVVEHTDDITFETSTDILLYRLVGYNDMKQPIYIRTIPKGISDRKGNKVYEYDYDNSGVSSAFPENKVKGIMVKKNGVWHDNRENFNKLIAKDIEGNNIMSESSLTNVSEMPDAPSNTLTKIDSHNTTQSPIKPNNNIDPLLQGC